MSREEEIIEIWMEAWINKQVPSVITDYHQWRDFLDFWRSECIGLSIEQAWGAYRINETRS